MTQDKQNKDHQKHISMELTADGARVTNLSLQGSRLILTIEAELADSQLHASDASGSEAVAAAFRPKTSAEPRKDTDFLAQPQSAAAPNLGLAAAPEPAPGPLAMGSENLPPAPSAAFEPAAPKSMTIAPEQISTPDDAPGVGLAPAPLPHFAPETPAPAPEPMPSASDTQPLPFGHGFGEALDTDFSAAPPAPPLEPVRELTETWDESIHENSPSPISIGRDPDATVPLPGLGFANAPDAAPVAPAPAPVPPHPTSESAREIKLGDDPFGPMPGLASPAPAPAPAHPAAAELRLGDDTPPPLPGWGGDIPPVANSSAPLVESWDPNSLRLDGDAAPAPQEPLAMSEDSSAVGGARHGEPLPAISFGSDEPALPPPSPAPIAMEPPPAFGFGDAAPGPVAPPMPAPIAPIGFDNPVPPPPAAPAMAHPGIGMASDEAPTQLAMRPPAPEPEQHELPRPAAPAPAVPAPEPAPDAGKAAAPKPDDDKAKNDAGGTTVLIRYTCPKCKTQGMQAVDKVGTVVNCSNCGKAMRLVMKK